MSKHPQKLPLIKHGWARAVLLLAVYIGLSVISGYAINLLSIGRDGGTFLNRAGGTVMDSLSMQIWITLSFIIAVSAVYLFRKYIDRSSFSNIGLKRSRIFPDGAIGLLSGILLLSIGSLVVFYLKGIEWVDISFQLGDIFISLVLLIMVAIAEELVFRGYVLHNLMKSFNKWIALVISAVLFSVVHSTNPDVHPIALVNVLLAGLLTGFVYIRTRSLWFSIFFHFSWNFFQGPVLGFPVSGLPVGSILTQEIAGNTLITGGRFGFEASLVCSVLLLVAIIPAYYFYPGRSRKPVLHK